MGYIIDPPQPVEGDYVAVFAQTEAADALAKTFLESRDMHPVVMPQFGRFAALLGAAIGPGPSLYGPEGLVCVPKSEAPEAIRLLESESGLLDPSSDADAD